ncbi:MAG TPA: portal protein, partial [Archangium sp.]|nr:portal protein [Archangium sp.]
GKPFFIAGDLSFTVLATNNRELQTQQIEEALRRYIRMAYNVSPELIGELGGANRSTAEEAKYILAEHAVLPRLEFLRASYQKFLVPKVDPDAIVTYDNPTPQAFERIVKVMTAAPNPAFTYRELRELVDYPEDEELGDMRPPFLPGAAPVQDTPPDEPSNPPPPRGPAAD